MGQQITITSESIEVDGVSIYSIHYIAYHMYAQVVNLYCDPTGDMIFHGAMSTSTKEVYTEPQKRPALPEDLPLKRNEACATVSGMSMKRNEAYSVVVPSQRGVAYENVERPANTLDTLTSPEYILDHTLVIIIQRISCITCLMPSHMH